MAEPLCETVVTAQVFCFVLLLIGVLAPTELNPHFCSKSFQVVGSVRFCHGKISYEHDPVLSPWLLVRCSTKVMVLLLNILQIC